MAASTAFDRIFSRLRLLYVLIGILYGGLFADIFLTIRLFQEATHREDFLVPVSSESSNRVMFAADQRPSAFPLHNDNARARIADDGYTEELSAASSTEATSSSKDYEQLKTLDVETLGDIDVNYKDRVNLLNSHDAIYRIKRRAWRYPREYNKPEDTGIPSVEFFPNPQPTHETDGFVWLTSYSRIPLQVLQEFCFSTKEFCPPGDKGEPGIPGTPGFKGGKGENGDRGLPGEPGLRGPQGLSGLMGPPGTKGEPGLHGTPGLDGRDGLPGEPGLDGVPGRDGVNGISGRDGLPGTPGTNGRPGTNGTNGISGSTGPRGLAGPPGPPGSPGPRGRKGVPGTSGTPGVPGINAWKVNATDTTALLVPPSIVDTEEQSTVVVQEGDNVRLRCVPTGIPLPKVTWRSDESKPIMWRSWQQSTVEGQELDITRVSRDHMSTYMCIASNGVPPPAFMKFKLEVTFPPLIKIKNQMVGTVNGSSAVLECFVEAFPQAVNFWLHGDGRLVEPSWKYKMTQKDDGYHAHMILNITFIDHSDYGLYKCVSKNDRGKTLGVFTVFEIDPNVPTRKPPVELDYTVYGQAPPPRIVETASCDPCPKCDPPPACLPTGQVGQPDISHVVSVLVRNTTLLTPPKPRINNCQIEQIGKPVFQRYTKEDIGAWMQDSSPSSENESKYYVTLSTDTNHLYEYASKDDFRKDNPSHRHDLHYHFTGNGHVIYNGSFYFHQERTNEVVRYDIANNLTKAEHIADSAYKGDDYLYSTKYSYMDLMADENGLWVIYSSVLSNNTMVRKLHPYTLATEYIWNITLNHKNVGDMFITCGVLYAVNSVTAATTQILFAFDLYQNKLLDVTINFSNPFRNNTMVDYNPRQRQIVTWDRGNQLLYPILWGTIDLGQPDVKSDLESPN